MAELTAKIFRDYFGGSWSGRITKNGEFQREIDFNWPETFNRYTALGAEEGLLVPPGLCVQDNTRQIAIAGWRSDTRRWCAHWHNNLGGYGELQFTSQMVVNGETILYGSLHECKQESDDPTEHIVQCEMFDKDNFKYTIQSFRKGLVEIVARRIRTAKELNTLLEKQVDTVINFQDMLRK